MLITKNSRLLQFIAFYDFVYFVSVISRQFILFVTKMEVSSRQNHEFTTCVHEFTAYLAQNRSRDHGEHEFTIPMERSITHYVLNFVAIPTRVARGKIRLAAFDGPSPKTLLLTQKFCIYLLHSYSQFCPKSRCRGNVGQSGININWSIP